MKLSRIAAIALRLMALSSILGALVVLFQSYASDTSQQVCAICTGDNAYEVALLPRLTLGIVMATSVMLAEMEELCLLPLLRQYLRRSVMLFCIILVPTVLVAGGATVWDWLVNPHRPAITFIRSEASWYEWIVYKDLWQIKVYELLLPFAWLVCLRQVGFGVKQRLFPRRYCGDNAV